MNEECNPETKEDSNEDKIRITTATSEEWRFSQSVRDGINRCETYETDLLPTDLTVRARSILLKYGVHPSFFVDSKGLVSIQVMRTFFSRPYPNRDLTPFILDSESPTADEISECIIVAFESRLAREEERKEKVASETEEVKEVKRRWKDENENYRKRRLLESSKSQIAINKLRAKWKRFLAAIAAVKESLLGGKR